MGLTAAETTRAQSLLNTGVITEKETRMLIAIGRMFTPAQADTLAAHISDVAPGISLLVDYQGSTDAPDRRRVP